MTIEQYEEYVARGLISGNEKYGHKIDVSSLFNYTFGELGEAVNALKHKDMSEVHNELGDTLWYFFALAHQLGFTVSSILEANMDKLNRRYAEDDIYE